MQRLVNCYPHWEKLEQKKSTMRIKSLLFIVHYALEHVREMHSCRGTDFWIISNDIVQS